MKKNKEIFELIPQLSSYSLKNDVYKQLIVYIVLRTSYKDKPKISLETAVNTFYLYRGCSIRTAYRHLAKPNPFFFRKGQDIHLVPIAKVAITLNIPKFDSIRLYPMKFIYKKTNQEIKALLYQDSIVRFGAKIIRDEKGVFIRHWNHTNPEHPKPSKFKENHEGKLVLDNKNGKLLLSSKDELIIKRKQTYPISRETITKRTGIPKSTQIELSKICKKEYNLYTEYNFIEHDIFSKEEYNQIWKRDNGYSKGLSPQLQEKILLITNGEKIGEKFKIHYRNGFPLLVEQFSNSYYDYIVEAPHNKVRKINHKIRKGLGKDLDASIFEKKSNYYLGNKYKNNGIYPEGSYTVKPFKKIKYWTKIENGKRISPICNLNLKDYLYKDNKKVKGYIQDILKEQQNNSLINIVWYDIFKDNINNNTKLPPGKYMGTVSDNKNKWV